jgi:CHAD domain-containing protein
MPSATMQLEWNRIHARVSPHGFGVMGARQTSSLVAEARTTPVEDVAGRMIGERLETVWAEASVAARQEREADAVHRLRVATRRAIAAIDAFADLLPARRRDWFEKRLRQLRRAAGEARDLDVLVARLTAADGADDTVALRAEGASHGRLVAMLTRLQRSSRRPIRDWYAAMLEAGWEGRVARLLARVKTSGCPSSFESHAERRFETRASRFFSRADRKLRTAAEMHRLRIEGKKLRYALEIFADVFPPDSRARCQRELERLQKRLGTFTDHAAAADRLRRLSRDHALADDRSTLLALRREEQARARQARTAFVKWWSPKRRRALRRHVARIVRHTTG